MSKYSIGIDYGTLSARAILVDMTDGKICAEAEYAYPHGVMDSALPDGTPLEKNSAFQHPRDYLDAAEYTIKKVIADSGVKSADILSLGIDFTACTILPVDGGGTPLCFYDEFKSEPHAYVKLWKHHSAQNEADTITRLAQENNQEWLKLYGGKVSSEWLFPKMLETLNKAPRAFDSAARFVEAADWLVYRLTGKEVHSSCMAGYKGMWNADSGYPSDEFLEKIHPKLKNVVGTKVSENILPTGSKGGEINGEGHNLVGLDIGTAVAVPIIDAHSALPAAGIVSESVLMAIIGTSTCHIIMNKEPKPVPGICGMVQDGVIPGFAAYEAGQAAVGDIFAWFIENCTPYKYVEKAKKLGMSIFDYMTEKAKEVAPGSNGVIALDWWNGNRTPYADYDLSGMLCGLTLTTKPEEIYRALIESTAFGTKRILDLYISHGVEVKEIYASGGIAQKNPLLMQIYADVCGMKIKVPTGRQAAAKGGAILAACACGYYDTFKAAADAMADKDIIEYTPKPKNTEEYDKVYSEYCELSEYFAKRNK